MVKAAWKHSKTWRPRRASVSPTLVRYSGQENHSKLRNTYIMYFTTKIGLLFSYLVNTCISHRGWNEVVKCGESLLYMKQERFKYLTTVRDHICLTCFTRQNLEQCWTAELWPAAGETEGPPAQGQGGGMLLWGHDCPQHPHGYETPGTGRRVPAHRQVSGATNFSFGLLCWAVLRCYK